MSTLLLQLLPRVQTFQMYVLESSCMRKLQTEGLLMPVQ
uniref:Uncharacterized protein n=1 Tax=Arundo donax TaxID=35708 RepID=A0A0A9FUN5_ARUDO